jgi:hypothetical protein
MNSFKLKIPAGRRGKLPSEPYGVFCLINEELRRKPGITDEERLSDLTGLMTTADDSEPRLLTIGQNHGIRDRNASARMKVSFREAMPKIIEMFPEMVSPFVGHVKFYSVGAHLSEIHFIPNP